MKQISEVIKMTEEPLIPTLDGKPGEDFCQVCGEKTKYAGGPSYDIEHFECTKCRALHIVRVEYERGKPVRRILESVY